MATVVPQEVLGERLALKGVVGLGGGVTEGARRATGVTRPPVRWNGVPPLPA